MLALGAMPRVGGELLPGDSSVTGRRGADSVPTVGRIARAEAKVPSMSRGRRGYSLSPLGQWSALRRGDPLAADID